MSEAFYTGLAPNSGPAPPPPPPPPGIGQVPALRISTASEVAAARRNLQHQQQDAYEPPAAIQNAMMTKDKKPFTYTPGMGGKLDLSQIRSPRMARRVAKNANDEGIDGPPKSDQVDSPQTPHQQPTFYSQPQVAVPVFPQACSPAQVNLRNSCLPRNPLSEQQQQPNRPQIRLETSRSIDQPSSPSPTSPTQVTLAKAPTPWMQKQSVQQANQQLPEWAKRSKDQAEVVQQFIPQQQMRPVYPTPPANERSVPLRIEDRPSVFSAINEPGQHHQFTNSNPHHMSRWGNPMGQSGYQPSENTVSYEPQYEQNQARAPQRVLNYNTQTSEPGPLQSQSFRVLQKITDTADQQPIDPEQMRKLQLTEDDRYLMNKFKEQVDGENYLHQEEDPRYRGAAIPSRAFRYLQTMTDSAVDSPPPNCTPRPSNTPMTRKPNNRQSNCSFVEVQPAQPYIPASQQQVQEPKKYTGGAIPSRSFRILQQMTTPESIGCPWRYSSPLTSNDCGQQCWQQERQEETNHGKEEMKMDEAKQEKEIDEEEEGKKLEEEVEKQIEEDEDEEVEETIEVEEIGEEEGEGEVEEEQEDEDYEGDESSDSSCDSESYLAYSTGLNPLNGRQTAETCLVERKECNERTVESSIEESSDLTDCEEENPLEDELSEQNEEITVSVSLPLRSKCQSVERAEEELEACVNFTFKRTNSNSPEKEQQQTSPEEEEQMTFEQVEDNQPLSIVENNEATSEPKSIGKRVARKYDRTQTHSRLFKLLSDEPLPRECKRPADSDSYYQTWKSYSNNTAITVTPTPTLSYYAARHNRRVFCPRTNSSKNLARLLNEHHQRPPTSTRVPMQTA